jgi:hypothetical protein
MRARVSRKRKSKPLVAVALLILGIVMFFVSNISYYNKLMEVKREINSWEIEDFFKGGDIIQVVVKANNDWGHLITDEVEVAINVSFITPEGEVNCTVYYLAYPSTSSMMIAPNLELINVTVNGAQKGLKISSPEEFLGGIVEKTGNYKVRIDEKSIWNNFLSKKPPAMLILYKKELVRPYSILTLPSVIIILLSIFILIICLSKGKK